MEQIFRRDITDLQALFGFVDQFCLENKLEESISYVLNLAAEEIFTNMVKYNAFGSNDIPISIHRNDNKVIMKFTDVDCEEFDLTLSEADHIDLPLKQKKIGGLGIHLIKQMVDEIQYQYKDRNSEITIIKNLEN